MVSACGGSDDEDAVFVQKDSGTGGKDSGAGGKDAGKDSSSGGSAGEAGSAGAAGSGGSSGAAGGGGSAGSAGAGGTKPDGGTGNGGTGGDAGKCEDNASNEPNDSENSAATASAAVCGAAGKELSGVIAGNDQDWYTYAGGGGITCATSAPNAKVDHAALRACVFAECNAAGTTGVTCAQGSVSTSPGGLKGCCANGGSEAEANVACSNLLDKSVTVYMRVDQSPASPAACFAYKLSYSL